MVEYTYDLDTIFGSLSDGTRRDILKRIIENGSGMSVSVIAEPYSFSFAAIAKHLEVLVRAGLVRKTRQGKQQVVTVEKEALVTATEFLEEYKRLWDNRLDSLGEYLKSIKK
jgi:DNA-binding transcriptional ArsR family regulator